MPSLMAWDQIFKFNEQQVVNFYTANVIKMTQLSSWSVSMSWDGFLLLSAALGILISYWQIKHFSKFYFLASSQSNYIQMKLFWKYLLAQPGEKYQKLSFNIFSRDMNSSLILCFDKTCMNGCLCVRMGIFEHCVCSCNRCVECLVSRWASIKRKEPKAPQKSKQLHYYKHH